MRRIEIASKEVEPRAELEARCVRKKCEGEAATHERGAGACLRLGDVASAASNEEPRPNRPRKPQSESGARAQSRCGSLQTSAHDGGELRDASRPTLWRGSSRL